MAKKTLTLTWVVDEDLTSERVEQYRNLIMKAVQEHRCNGEVTADDLAMIDRLCWDHLDGLMFDLIKARRSCWKFLNKGSNGDPHHVIPVERAVCRRHGDRRLRRRALHFD